MKKLILSLLTVTLFSCTSEEVTETGSGFIPDRFSGSWVSLSGLSAEIKTNKISFGTTAEGTVTRTRGTVVTDNGNEFFHADLENKEVLRLLLNVRDKTTPKDDMVGISFIRDNRIIHNVYYTRK